MDDNHTDFRFPFRSRVLLILGLVLVLGAHLALRLTGLLDPEDYRLLLPASFALLWVTPFLFFPGTGRIAMGFHHPKGWYWLPLALFLGFGLAVTAYWVAYTFFGSGEMNWFASVRDNTLEGLDRDAYEKDVLFWIVTVPALIFSPLGEEFFFRGVMDQSIRARWDGIWALGVNSVLFGAIHLFHHGIYFGADGPVFLGVSAVIWFAITANFAVLLTVLRRASASIWTPVAAHAAFNFGMYWTIFRYLMGAPS